MRRPTQTRPTRRNLDVLRFVQRHFKEWDCAPTRAEIGAALGMSRPMAESHLQVLERLRYVRLAKRWRGIELRGGA